MRHQASSSSSSAPLIQRSERVELLFRLQLQSTPRPIPARARDVLDVARHLRVDAVLLRLVVGLHVHGHRRIHSVLVASVTWGSFDVFPARIRTALHCNLFS